MAQLLFVQLSVALGHQRVTVRQLDGVLARQSFDGLLESLSIAIERLLNISVFHSQALKFTLICRSRAFESASFFFMRAGQPLHAFETRSASLLENITLALEASNLFVSLGKSFLMIPLLCSIISQADFLLPRSLSQGGPLVFGPPPGLLGFLSQLGEIELQRVAFRDLLFEPSVEFGLSSRGDRSRVQVVLRRTLFTSLKRHLGFSQSPCERISSGGDLCKRRGEFGFSVCKSIGGCSRVGQLLLA